MEKNILTVKILEGVEKSDGCPLCYLWTRSEEYYVKQMLTNEVTMNPEFRGKVAVKGFCNRHAHMLYKTIYKSDVEDGLGYALYMKDIIERIKVHFSSLRANSLNISEPIKSRISLRKKPSIIKYKTQKQQCPICEYLLTMDQVYLHTLLQMLENEDFRKNFNSSKWLCLPHFMLAIQMIQVSNLSNPTSVLQALLDSEVKQIQLIEDLLSDFIRKRRWEFRNEPVGLEVNANLFALNFLVGVEGLNI